MKDSKRVITCQSCGAKNRVALEKLGQAVCGKCKDPIALIRTPVIITDSSFPEEVGKSRIPVLLDFWATWCPPCKLIAPIIDKLAEELAGQIKVGKLDVDQNPVTSGQYRVQSIPTLIIFKNGREVDRIVGAQSKEALMRRLQAFL